METQKITNDSRTGKILSKKLESVKLKSEPKISTINLEFKAEKTAKAEGTFDIGI